MSTNARDRPIIHAPPDLDLAAMVRVDASLGELTDDEIAAVTIFDTEHQLVSTNARDDQIKAVLLDAAKLVERGWHQGGPWIVKGGRKCYCVWAAVLESYWSSGALWDRDLIAKLLYDEIGLSSSESIGSWNDAPERTQAEVVAALRGAAEGLGKESGE